VHTNHISKTLTHCFRVAVILSVSLLAACGGGGKSAGDVIPGQSVAAAVVTGPDQFLLFPNPVINVSGTSEIDSPAYAQAYYSAIDPANSKDTFAKWQSANGFGSGTGSEVTVVFGDVRDLGYGRRIVARKNVNGTMAFSVENYLVPTLTGYSYSSLNLDAAVVQDKRWYIGSSNIEFSPGPNGGVSFAKFFFFDPNGQRATSVNLDGRGAKAMPGPCITCHGGRGDGLTPPDATGKQLFPLVHNSASMHRGDVQGRLPPLEVDAFSFSTSPSFTRAAQEASFKLLNSWILCSYPIASGTVPAAEDVCRRTATADEWQGGADAIIKSGYGGAGLPSATYSNASTPADWVAAGQQALYQNAVVPACRACHILRGAGSGGGAEIDLSSHAKYSGFSDQIWDHVFNRGDMPLAKIIYDDFWGTLKASSFATFLEGLGLGFVVRDPAGSVLKPGRPIADPGPNRVVVGPTTLSAINSLYADTYSWTLVSSTPALGGAAISATLTNPTSVQTAFNPSGNGTYIVQLIANKGGVQSAPVNLTIVVNNVLPIAPAAIRFADIKAVLTGCSGCHSSTSMSVPALTPNIFNSIDRNGDGLVDATDDQWFYHEVRSKVNFKNIIDSPLLLKPSGKHHDGGTMALAGFDTTKPPGDPARTNYDLFVNWILNGSPQ
jgi:mono/diheme cytochrome c family protein